VLTTLSHEYVRSEPATPIDSVAVAPGATVTDTGSCVIWGSSKGWAEPVCCETMFPEAPRIVNTGPVGCSVIARSWVAERANSLRGVPTSWVAAVLR
jgi:hypothetical protein